MIKRLYNMKFQIVRKMRSQNFCGIIPVQINENLAP